MRPILQIYNTGFEDAQNCCIDSEDFRTPVGGWDGWLLSVGLDASEAFGVDRDAWYDFKQTREFEFACRVYSLGATKGAAEVEDVRRQRLMTADRLGYRICVFGLPGSNTHNYGWTKGADLVNDLSDRLFQPGPCGPYESEIVKPSDADLRRWRDGRPIYREIIDEILQEIS